MAVAFAEIAFTPSVLTQQEKMGSQRYIRLLDDERTGGDRLGIEEKKFIEARDGFYQATTSETGWPYVQFRGGPAGFVQVIDDRHIAYADLRGNRQYLSVGNLTVNDRISLIFVDYVNARRLKVWGRVRIMETDRDTGLLARLADAAAQGVAERAVVIRIEAIDWNCPQHIPHRLTPEEFSSQFLELERERNALAAENAALRKTIKTLTHPTEFSPGDTSSALKS